MSRYKNFMEVMMVDCLLAAGWKSDYWGWTFEKGDELLSLSDLEGLSFINFKKVLYLADLQQYRKDKEDETN